MNGNPLPPGLPTKLQVDHMVKLRSCLDTARVTESYFTALPTVDRSPATRFSTVTFRKHLFLIGWCGRASLADRSLANSAVLRCVMLRLRQVRGLDLS